MLRLCLIPPPQSLFPFCRTISEKIKIFEDFVQAKKKRLIDALKRNGIEFREEGEETANNVLEDKNGGVEWLPKNLKSKRGKGTIIVGSGANCVTILPPYEKVILKLIYGVFAG